MLRLALLLLAYRPFEGTDAFGVLFGAIISVAEALALDLALRYQHSIFEARAGLTWAIEVWSS